MSYSIATPQYVNQVLAGRRTTYLGDPTLIIQDYNQEKGITEDYDGRQLLELLQNANDAARFGEPGSRRVIIRLTNNILEVANTGEKFTQEGMRSILYSYLSPKPLDPNQIGSKGLGFRAMLNWTEGIEIHSGELHVAFSESIAREFLAPLLENPKVNGELEAYHLKEPLAPLPVAVLRCPKLLQPNQESEECWTSYSTRIQLNLLASQLSAVREQIRQEITAEVLVFLPNIDKLTIEVDGLTGTWQRTVVGTDQRQLIKVSYTDSAGSVLIENSWQVLTDRGNLPPDCQPTKGPSTTGTARETPYEVRVAWSSEKGDLAPGMLYSYFRTGISFPLPIRAHGTFDLTGNRQNLQSTTANKWLLERLGKLLVAAATEIAQTGPADPYLPLSLLWGGADTDWQFDSVLDQLGLGSALKNALSEASIFPVISGKYKSAAEVVYYEKPFAFFLNSEGDSEELLCWPCPTAAPATTDDHFALKMLKQTMGRLNSKPQYSPIRLLTRISTLRPTTANASYSTYAHLLHLVDGLIRSDANFSASLAKSSSSIPALFGDESGDAIEPNQGVFLPPDNSHHTRLPGLAVINLSLAKALSVRFSAHTFQALSSFLQPLRVRAYSFNELVAQVIKRSGNEPEKLHPVLFRLYQAERTNLSSAPPIPTQPVPLRTRKQKITAPANTLYFGREYDGPEALCAALYFYDQSKLVAEPSALGLVKLNLPDIRAYLVWCGVVDRPRWVPQREGVSVEYQNYVLRRFNYKQSVDNNTFRNYAALKVRYPNFNSYSVGTIDSLHAILTRNNPSTILRWVKEDKALASCLDRDRELDSSYLHIGPYKENRYLRPEQMSSYVRWQFATIPWLPVLGSTERHPPIRAILPGRGQLIDDFTPLLFTPDLVKLEGLKKGAKKTVSGSKQLVDLLPRLGVNKGLSELPTELLYEVLLELPVRDKEGKRVKTLYQELAANYDQDGLDVEDPQRLRFLREGQVWCYTPGGERYVLLKEDQARYVPEATYGAGWIQQFTTLAVEPRRGAGKIERLFGVPPLRSLSFSVVGSPSVHSQNADFQLDWKHLLPYLYALLPRIKTADGKGERLKSLQLQLTTALSISHNDGVANQSTLMEALPLFGHLYLPATPLDRPRAWVVAPADLTVMALKCTVGFADALAELLSNLLEASDYRDAFYTYATLSPAQRDEKLQRDLGKSASDILNRAREVLDLQLEAQQDFWGRLAGFLRPDLIGPIPTTDSGWHAWFESYTPAGLIQSELRHLYDTLPAPETWQAKELGQVLELFQLLCVSPVDFNRNNPRAISFQPYLQQLFKGLILRLGDQFAHLLYESLMGVSIAQQRCFQARREEFYALQAPEAIPLDFEVEAYFSDTVQKRFNVNLASQPKNAEFSLSAYYKENEQLLIARPQALCFPTSYIIQTFLGSPERRSLLYFGQLDQLVKELPSPPASTVNSGGGGSSPATKRPFQMGNQTLLYSELSDLAPQLLKQWPNLDLKIRNLTTHRNQSAENSAKGGQARSPRAGSGLGKSEKNSIVGAVGEWIAFQALKAQYGADKVKWISENATFMGHEQGRAGEGYDLVYEDSKGQPHYVEVKASSETQQKQFYISAGEVRYGEANRANYDIILVAGIQSPQGPTVERLRQPFAYSRNESFMNNQRFSVQEESFLVRFATEAP